MTNLQVEARAWWVERWLELLDSYRFKKRLERARIYAKEGNVLNIEFVGEQVLASVQGSEAEPYRVSLSLAPFTEEDWHYLIHSLGEKAIFSAQLLAGQMPDEIERVFIENGLSLFPFSLADVQSRCSCPDKANPCKHIGAVYYQLGDRFSEDPFVIFQLRGRTKEQILAALRQQRNQSQAEANPIPLAQATLTPASDPLLPDLEKFWAYRQPLEPSLAILAPSPEQKTPLHILGNIPLPYGESAAFGQYLAQIYPQLTQKVIALANSNRPTPM